VRSLLWTEQAQEDLHAIHAFVSRDSPRYAALVVAGLLAAVRRLAEFPQSGRVVAEFGDPSVREVIRRPYRIVYRLVGTEEVHVLTIHHSARILPADL
jgi:plasmid stabilization system protein ParE